MLPLYWPKDGDLERDIDKLAQLIVSKSNIRILGSHIQWKHHLLSILLAFVHAGVKVKHADI